MIDRALLQQEAAALGVALSEEMLARFDRYAQLLLTWNQKFNLTAITAPDEVVKKHFADSLALLKYCEIGPDAAVCDVGAGAGFPSVPLAIARPDLTVTQIDSLNKRVGFLNMLAAEMPVRTRAVHLRAEDAGQDPAYRERFDFVTARAVANLAALCEYCLPLVRPGGVFAALKGAAAEEELAKARAAIQILGGKTEEIYQYQLGGEQRAIILIKKISQTATKYPRPAAKMKKFPLEKKES